MSGFNSNFNDIQKHISFTNLAENIGVILQLKIPLKQIPSFLTIIWLYSIGSKKTKTNATLNNL